MRAKAVQPVNRRLRVPIQVRRRQAPRADHSDVTGSSHGIRRAGVRGFLGIEASRAIEEDRGDLAVRPCRPNVKKRGGIEVSVTHSYVATRNRHHD